MVYQNYRGSILRGHYFNCLKNQCSLRYYQLRELIKTWQSFDPFTHLISLLEWTEWRCRAIVAGARAVSPGCGARGLTASVLRALTPARSDCFLWAFVLQPVSWCVPRGFPQPLASWLASVRETLMLAWATSLLNSAAVPACPGPRDGKEHDSALAGGRNCVPTSYFAGMEFLL